MPFKKGQSGNPGGKPKGAKNQSTLDKEARREVLRQQIAAEIGPMTEAQIKNAKGISYLVYRNKKGGKFTKVTADTDLDAVLKDDNLLVEIWAERPNVASYTDLLNRALDKPAEQRQEIEVNAPGVESLLARLLAGRERLKSARNGEGT